MTDIELFPHQVPFVSEQIIRQGKIRFVCNEAMTATAIFESWPTPFSVYFHELTRSPEIGDGIEITLTLIGERLSRKFRLIDAYPVNWKKEGF